MSAPLIRPRRRLRSEIFSLLPILAFPVVLALVFPFRAIGFRYEPKADPEPHCQFVVLDAEAERQAMELLQSAFAVRPGRLRELQADLSLSTLPEERTKPVLTIADLPRPEPASALPYDAVLMPPSLAAEPLEELPESPAPEPAKPAFSREEMLKTDLLNPKD